MRVSIASGKGGTGKTTLATNMAVLAAQLGRSVHLLDCDVEEPNGHLFLRPEWERTEPVNVPIPVIDRDACRHCGKCAEICEFNALACLPDDVMVFPELCHSCGGCWLVCPFQAISRGEREVGVLETGRVRGLRFTHGRLRVGEVQAPPLIEQVLASAEPEDELVLVDAPPGASCPVVAALRGSDFVLLVTEPTPFGLNDLRLAVDLVRELGIPFGVVVNRAGIGDDRVRRFCEDDNVRLLLEIPHDRRVAEAYARGVLAVDAVPELREGMIGLLEAVAPAASKGAAR